MLIFEQMQLQKNHVGQEMLKSIPLIRGIMWEKIEEFGKMMASNIEGCITHTPGNKQSKEMQEAFPVKQHLENGLYTREVLMPKGSLVISLIHKQNHPSFFLEGEMSILADNGEVKELKAPMNLNTKIGTQRVAYMHEDCKWICVYKTDATTFEEAEVDVYTNNYRELPIELINNNKLLWQE